MTLFDVLAREDVSRPYWAEPEFEFLNRSARATAEAIRSELEAWFAALPLESQGDLRGRFRSRRNEQHEAAFFELYLHALLCKMGCTVHLHPILEDAPTRPDFLIESENGHSYYLEAAVCRDRSLAESAAEARVNELWDTLDSIRSPDYTFGVAVSGLPAATITGRRIKEKIIRELTGLDKASVVSAYRRSGWESLPKWTFSESGAEIEVRAIPLRDGAQTTGRAIGLRTSPVKRLATDESIRRSLGAKGGSKYGRRELPVVVALNIVFRVWC